MATRAMTFPWDDMKWHLLFFHQFNTQWLNALLDSTEASELQVMRDIVENLIVVRLFLMIEYMQMKFEIN